MSTYSTYSLILNDDKIDNYHDFYVLHSLSTKNFELSEMLELIVDYVEKNIIINVDVIDDQTGEILFIFHYLFT